VYRIRIPAHGGVRVRLATVFGDADLFAFPGNRKSLSGTPAKRSQRNGRATDAFTLTNPSRTPRRFYIAIVSASRTSLNSAYSLTFRRR
jgi:hypothetical protein